MPPWPSFATVRSDGRLAGQQPRAAAGPRPSPSSRRRTSAARGSPSGRPGRARASSPGGPARRGARPGRRARRSPRSTASSGSVLAAPAVRIRSTGSAPPDEPRQRRPRRRPGRPRRSRSPTIAEPRPSTLARTLASNRSRAVRAHRFLDDRPRRGTARTARPRRAGASRSPASRAPASTIAASTTCGATLTLATRSPGSTTWPSKTVKTSSGSIRLSRSSSAIRTLTTPARVGDAGRPGSGPGRGSSRPGPATAVGEADRRLVLVELAGLRDEHGDRRPGFGGRRAPARSSARQPPTLRPARAADTSGRARGRRPTRRAGARRPGVTRSTRTR